jgi:hypothetical protein
MKTDYNLEFLKTKIRQTGTALCSVHLPGFTNTSYIIHTNSVDDEGNISFSLIDSLPKTSAEDLTSFGVRLFYFKKGLGYHLNVEAQASAVHPKTGETDKEEDDKNMLTIKARIMSAEYNENPRTGNNNRKNLIHTFRKKVSQAAAGLFWM